MRSIVIFLMITSRPPTAVTTCFVLMPETAISCLMASATMPGSMTSPSTMASSTTDVKATFVSTGSLPPPCWMATSLISPLPMSRPTVVRFRPKSAMGAELLGVSAG